MVYSCLPTIIESQSANDLAWTIRQKLEQQYVLRKLLWSKKTHIMCNASLSGSATSSFQSNMESVERIGVSFHFAFKRLYYSSSVLEFICRTRITIRSPIAEVVSDHWSVIDLLLDLSDLLHHLHPAVGADRGRRRRTNSRGGGRRASWGA